MPRRKQHTQRRQSNMGWESNMSELSASIKSVLSLLKIYTILSSSFSRQGLRSQRSTPSNTQSGFMISSPPFCPNCCLRLEWGGVTGGHIWAHILGEVLLWVTDPVSLTHLSQDHVWDQSRFFFVYNMFTFSPLLGFSVGLWLHVVNKAYMWYSYAYIAFCTFVLDIVDYETEWCCLCPATWYDYHTGILKTAYIYCPCVLCGEKIIVLKGIVYPKNWLCWKRTPPQTFQDVIEFVSSYELIWRNLALHQLLTNASSAVNGCRQNESW